jgi:hypothetical protein
MESATLDYRLFPGFWVTALRVLLAGAYDPVPGVPDGLLDLLPGGWFRTTMLVAVPAPANVGFRFLPVPAKVVLRRLETIAEGGTETIVKVRAQRVGTAAEVLEPVIVLGFPGGLPGGILERRNTVEGIRFRHGVSSYKQQ